MEDSINNIISLARSVDQKLSSTFKAHGSKSKHAKNFHDQESNKKRNKSISTLTDLKEGHLRFTEVGDANTCSWNRIEESKSLKDKSPVHKSIQEVKKKQKNSVSHRHTIDKLTLDLCDQQEANTVSLKDTNEMNVSEIEYPYEVNADGNWKR